MPVFSRSSKKKLQSCCEELQRICNVAIKGIDFSVIRGHRDKVTQNLAYDAGYSMKKYPNSKHNKTPSFAVDIVPYIKGKGISWNPFHCLYLAGYIMRVADELGISIRYGGNWDMDDEVYTDQSFQDLCHFELK